jgi:2-polyprenyl-3-methyl-5-hydroxy-6-metoxy-1,4-benzoquinol methylase
MNICQSIQPSCLICGQVCQTTLSGLFDVRFGAPGRYNIVQCTQCGLMQTWPRPSETKIKELYECFYNRGAEKNTTYDAARQYFLTSSLYRLWLRWDGDVFFQLRGGAGRLLDVGCNEGRGLSWYIRNGFHAEGLEINERAAAVARENGYTVHVTPLSEFDSPESYDVIILSNVLEHVLDPLAMLTNIRRLLKPGGQVWISLPNADSFWSRVFGPFWINWHVPYHICHFSPHTLKALLAQANFRPCDLKTYTPAISIATSLCARIAGQEGKLNRWMRSVPVIASLMFAIRALLLPIIWSHNKKLRGDYLILTARVSPE